MIQKMSFAVIKTGGKQYKVQEGDRILVEKLDQPVGTEFDFEEILLVGNSGANNFKIGTPLVGGAKVRARILEHIRGEKKIIFKYKPKTRYKKKKGHRQPYTKVEILKITA
jgi:large subunit ribosomal protein L21